MARRNTEDGMWRKKTGLEKAAEGLGAAVGKADRTARAAAKAAQEGTRAAMEAAEVGIQELSRTVASIEKDLKRLKKRFKKAMG